MRSLTFSCPVWLLPVLAMLAGCGTNREAVLIGKWETSGLVAPMLGFKLKEENPSASPSEAMGGGRVLGTAAMEIRKDKTFQLAWIGNVMEGTWTFDKEDGETILNVTKAQPLPGGQHLPFKTLVAYLDPDNLRLRLYPGGPVEADIAKKSGGPMADGIPLKKAE